MTTLTYNTQQDVVKDTRKIRDQTSNEIKDVTFEEEHAYSDQLLADKEKVYTTKGVSKYRLYNNSSTIKND